MTEPVALSLSLNVFQLSRPSCYWIRVRRCRWGYN